MTRFFSGVVAPAVVETSRSGGGCGGSSGCGGICFGGGRSSSSGGGLGSGVSAVIAGAVRGEKADAFAVCSGKVGVEVGPGPFWVRPFAPITDGVCEDAGFFEHGECFSDSRAFGDGVETAGGKTTAFLGILPDGLNRVRWIPLAVESHGVGFKLVGSDGSVGSVEMREKKG